MNPNRSTVKGKVVEVDICEQGIGYVLSVGAVSLWLGPAVAVDVLETLARAIAVQQDEQAKNTERDAPRSRAVLRRRIFS
jgi:hypothetical protein